MDEQKDILMVRQMDGQMDGGTDGQMDRQITNRQPER